MNYCSFLFLAAVSSALVSAYVDELEVESSSEERIAGGTKARRRKVPYHVSIESSGHLVCAGSIVGPKWVMTTGLCVAIGAPVSNIVRAGSRTVGSGGTTYFINSVYFHPDLSPPNFDVGLIKLRTNFKFGSHVQAISVATADPVAGTPVIVSGWGGTSTSGSFTPILQSGTMAIVSRTICDNKYSSTPPITTNVLCAGNSTTNICDGDLGDPLVDIAAKAQVGVALSVPDCGAGDVPGLFANVGAAPIRTWIAATAGI